MSTLPHAAEPETPTPTRTRFTTRDAPYTFSPQNTDPCPRMFADRWRVEPEADSA